MLDLFQHLNNKIPRRVWDDIWDRFSMTIRMVESVNKEEKMKYVLFLMMILFSNQAVALNCEKQPTCEELNYSKDDDPQCAEDGYILCPFDFSYKKCLQPDCEKMGYTKSNKSGWCGKLAFCPNDKTYTACKALCEIGDVYYADGTCGYAEDYDNSKTPVGVVVTVNAEGTHGKILALNDLTLKSDYTFDEKNPFGGSIKEIPFGGYHYERLGTHTYNTNNILSAFTKHDTWLWDGLSATKAAIVETPQTIGDGCQLSDKKGTLRYAQYCDTPGPRAAMTFYPEGVSENDAHLGKGKWYVPSLGEWMDVVGTGYTTLVWENKYRRQPDYKQVHLDQINTTLSRLQQKGKAQSLASYYYSSTFFDSRTFWTFNLESYKTSIEWTDRSYRIRPMTTF